LVRRGFVKMSVDPKEVVEGLKVEWKRLWLERLDDKVRAEGIAVHDYSSLFVDKGTVIHATRNFRALNFKEILERHQIDNTDRYVHPTPQVGGWNKFIKQHVTSQNHSNKKRAELFEEMKGEKQQPKKGGRGWLHI